jgi:hypothetical protein
MVRRAADHDARGGRARRLVARRARGRLDLSGFLVLLAAGAVLAAAGAAFFERRDLGR